MTTLRWCASSGAGIALRVSGAFRTEADVLNVSLVANGRTIRLGDIATVRRGFVDPPQPLFHVNGKRAIGLGISALLLWRQFFA